MSDSHSWKSCSSGSYAYTESVLNLYVVFDFLSDFEFEHQHSNYRYENTLFSEF